MSSAASAVDSAEKVAEALTAARCYDGQHLRIASASNLVVDSKITSRSFSRASPPSPPPPPPLLPLPPFFFFFAPRRTLSPDDDAADDDDDDATTYLFVFVTVVLLPPVALRTEASSSHGLQRPEGD